MLLPSTLRELVEVEDHKNHLVVLSLVHFGVLFEWVKACFSPWYFPNGKRILITMACCKEYCPVDLEAVKLSMHSSFIRVRGRRLGRCWWFFPTGVQPL